MVSVFHIAVILREFSAELMDDVASRRWQESYIKVHNGM